MPAVSFQELIASTSASAVSDDRLPDGFDHVETDSRQVRCGDLFWALKGERHDGHDFVDQAFANGAAACVVQAGQHIDHDGLLIEVDDTTAAFGRFAAWYREQMDAITIGVTGSVGKTTTRHMIHTVLSGRFSGTQSPKNFNNHFGVPLSLLGIAPDDEFAVLELAASGIGEICRLATIARPEIGVITRIAPTHLDEFGSIDNICSAKGELLEALPPSGFAVINGDDDRVLTLASRAGCPVIRVGEQPHNDVIATNVVAQNEWLRFRVGETDFSLPAVGRHHLTAALVAIAIAREIGMSDGEIAAALRQFEAVPGRCQIQRIGDWTVIDDTYNASPASMQAACEILGNWQHGHNTILVAGDMLALGDESEQYHEQLGRTVAQSGISRLIAIGPQAANLAGTAKAHGMDAGCLGACRDLTTLELLLDCWLEAGDVILVKGSRGMHMERVIEHLRTLASRRSTPTHSLRHVA
ncbi:UDP-N-acetylmuramoyl-tripeptide--D-alanyl-D-alanine ligase MurF [Maioricimonas rarisocia]|uniref:UDP-N-acetylmuramoyl-tripeptide--D-alanyl-D-alanine ligase n=1 Tax=Maioricimonas rarisocia TaxID=2528026 RepID=A0A517Z1U4_9PLAN|nr:UDP-N-acetylmuramoyl-tripeptide--D-alanyl-D-alanine ligase [Maioricimonas rarisocia]QDU36466.1 UDP-N-acetylmuramoyl-tripeptide--D-alanyl-D-alanine ligase MurF [Maioricimonas rarisocia]